MDNYEIEHKSDLIGLLSYWRQLQLLTRNVKHSSNTCVDPRRIRSRNMTLTAQCPQSPKPKEIHNQAQLIPRYDISLEALTWLSAWPCLSQNLTGMLDSVADT